jgi:IPT/TIG domain
LYRKSSPAYILDLDVVQIVQLYFTHMCRVLTRVSKYKDGLFRIILREDGKSVAPESIPAIPLVGDNTLSVTQTPEGSLIDTRYLANQIFVHTPVQVVPMKDVLIYGVFPRRGGQAGGYILSIYGFNFQKGSVFVKVGKRKCPIISVKPKRITCRVYGGKGTVDVFVKVGKEKVTLDRGFRYISGLPDN